MATGIRTFFAARGRTEDSPLTVLDLIEMQETLTVATNYGTDAAAVTAAAVKYPTTAPAAVPVSAAAPAPTPAPAIDAAALAAAADLVRAAGGSVAGL